MFHIRDFCSSIKEKLLWETIRFAKRYISITNKDIEAIFYARKSLLYYNVDATMGAYIGAEVCESIGILCCHSLVNTLTR